jgi:putative FmdB family regulatory protein
MPFYEYECKSCGHEVEAMQKVSDAPLKKCPECGKSQLQRLMSAPVFRLKGGGWYETDFKGDKDKQRNLAERPETVAATDSDAKGTEAKPESKAEAKAESSTANNAAPKSAEKPAEKATEKSAGKANGAVTRTAKRSTAKSSTKKTKGKSKRRHQG